MIIGSPVSWTTGVRTTTAHATDELGEGDVAVWLARPDEIRAPELVARYERVLSPDEHEQHARFRREADRHLYLVAHALVRCVLARYARLAPEALVFATNRHGRPELAPAPRVPLHFNLTHTHGLVACAVSRREVGVDVESLDRHTDVDGLVGDVLSAHEAYDVSTTPASQRPLRFLHYWTLKEAYIKARGMGLALPLDRFTFVLEPHGGIAVRFERPLNDAPEDWQFALYQPTASHLLAIASHHPRGSDLAIGVREIVPFDS